MAITRYGPSDWKWGFRVASGSDYGWLGSTVLTTSAGVEAGTVGSPLYVTVAAGGGGAVTIADGADVAEGATAATAYSDATGAAAGTLVALGKGNYVITAAMSAKLPATLGQKTGANSLSVVWASDATLPTGTNTIGTVLAQGTLANLSTSSPNPFLQAARFMTTQPTYTNGQLGEIQMDSRGDLKVALTSVTNTAAARGAANNLSYNILTAGGSPLQMEVRPYRFNGTTFDPEVKPNLIKRVASSAASGNPDFLKASAGEVSQFWGSCGAIGVFLQLYNKASAPTVGTDVPVLTYPIAATTLFTQTFPNGGMYFPTGIAFAFTTDAAATTASAAAAITSFALIGM